MSFNVGYDYKILTRIAYTFTIILNWCCALFHFRLFSYFSVSLALPLSLAAQFLFDTLEFNSKICSLYSTTWGIGGGLFAQNLKFYETIEGFTDEQKKQQQQRQNKKGIQHRNENSDVYRITSYWVAQVEKKIIWCYVQF